MQHVVIVRLEVLKHENTAIERFMVSFKKRFLTLFLHYSDIFFTHKKFSSILLRYYKCNLLEYPLRA